MQNENYISDAARHSGNTRIIYPNSYILSTKHTDSPIPFWGLLVFLFLLFISPQSFFSALSSLHVALLSAGFVALTFIIDRRIHRQPLLIMSREVKIVLLLIGWIVLSIPLSYWPTGSINTFTGIFLKTLIIFWLVSHIVNTLPRLRAVCWLLTLMTIPIALITIFHFITGKTISPDDTRILGYDAPLTANPNDLALTMNLLLPISIALFLSRQERGIRMLLIACILLEVAAIVVSFSRAGFLTLAIMYCIYLKILLNRNKWGVVILALFIPFAALPFVPAGYMGRLGTITEIDNDPTGSAQARWGDMIAATKYILDNPIIGAGIGMDKLALNEIRGPTWTEIHNVYLQYGVDLGLPGMFLFIALLLTGLANAKQVQKSTDNIPEAKELYYLSQGFKISLIAFAIASAFHPVAYHIYFYMIAGLILAAKTINDFRENTFSNGGVLPAGD